MTTLLQGEGVDEGGWCASESLLLLEALELYGDAWSRVAAHVGTKTQAQCLMHFLQVRGLYIQIYYTYVCTLVQYYVLYECTV